MHALYILYSLQLLSNPVNVTHCPPTGRTWGRVSHIALRAPSPSLLKKNPQDWNREGSAKITRLGPRAPSILYAPRARHKRRCRCPECQQGPTHGAFLTVNITFFLLQLFSPVLMCTKSIILQTERHCVYRVRMHYTNQYNSKLDVER
jgi:hypothetical protein